MLPVSTKSNSQFLSDIERLSRHNKSSCCFTQPYLFGRPIDLQKLYNEVIIRGGHKRVTSSHLWGEVYLRLGFPSGCVEAGHGLRTVYQRYLEAFERNQWMASKSNFVSDDVELSTNGDIDSQSTEQKSSRPIPSCSLESQFREDIPNHMRDSWKLSTDLVERVNYSYLEYALSSGLPNEVDFALNTILLMSSQPNGLNLHRNHRLLDLLLSSVGICDTDLPTAHRPSAFHRFAKFWGMRASSRNFQDSDYDYGRRLFNNYTPHEFSYGDNEGFRIQLVATVLRNLVVDSGLNAIAIGRNIQAMQFICLCSYTRHSSLRHIGLETLSSLNFPVVGTLVPILECMLPNLLTSQDRNDCIRGLLLMRRLCESPMYRTRYERHQRRDPREYPVFITDRNADFLLSLPGSVFQAIVNVLALRDLHLVVLALDAIYLLSCLGLPLCLRLLQLPTKLHVSGDTSRWSVWYPPGVRNLLTILVTLLSLEAQAMGSESLIRVRVMQALGATSAVPDKSPVLTPAKSEATSSGRSLLPASVYASPLTTAAGSSFLGTSGLPRHTHATVNPTHANHVQLPVRTSNQLPPQPGTVHTTPAACKTSIDTAPVQSQPMLLPRVSSRVGPASVQQQQQQQPSRPQTSLAGSMLSTDKVIAIAPRVAPSEACLPVKTQMAGKPPSSGVGTVPPNVPSSEPVMTTPALPTVTLVNNGAAAGSFAPIGQPKPTTEAQLKPPMVSVVNSAQPQYQRGFVLSPSPTKTVTGNGEPRHYPTIDVASLKLEVNRNSNPAQPILGPTFHKNLKAVGFDAKSPASNNLRREFMYEWLRNNYAVHLHSSISRVQIYTEYQKAHQREFGPGGAVLPIEFHTKIKSVFPSIGQVKVQMPGGAVEIHYNNLKHINAPEPESQQGVNDIMASVLSPRRVEPPPAPPQPRPGSAKSRKRASAPLASKLASSPTRTPLSPGLLIPVEYRPTKQVCRNHIEHGQLNGHMNGKELVARPFINGVSKDCIRRCSETQYTISEARQIAPQLKSASQVSFERMPNAQAVLPLDRGLPPSSSSNCSSLNELISKEDSNVLTFPLLACVGGQNWEGQCPSVVQTTTLVANLIGSRMRLDSSHHQPVLISMAGACSLTPTPATGVQPTTTSACLTSLAGQAFIVAPTDSQMEWSTPSGTTTTIAAVAGTHFVTDSSGSEVGRSTQRYCCSWGSCTAVFLDPNQLVSHVLQSHGPSGNAGLPLNCGLTGCPESSTERDPGQRAAQSHLAQCSSQHSKSSPAGPSALSALVNGHSTEHPLESGGVENPVTPADLTWRSSPSASISEECQRALAGGTPNSPFLVTPGREGPVTKHIRLTAALTMRNLLKFSAVARRYLVVWEDVLCELAFAGLESSPTIHECLTYLQDSVRDVGQV